MSEEAEGRDEREGEKTYLEFGQEMFVPDSGKSFLFVSKRQLVSCWLSGDKSAGIFCASLLNKSRGEYSRYSRETAANKQKKFLLLSLRHWNPEISPNQVEYYLS